MEATRTTPVVHVEFFRTGVFLDKVEEVQAYIDLKPTILASAASVDESLRLIAKYAKELNR